MAAAQASTKGGGGLGRKVGPLPLWAWLIVGAVAGYLLLHRSRQSSAVAGGQAAPAPSSFQSGADQGLVPQGGSSGDPSGGGDLVSALGAQQSSLVEGLLSSEQNVVALAQAQQASLTTTTATAPVDTSAGAGVSPQPGGSNAPQFTFVFPNLRPLPANTTSSTSGHAGKVKTAATAAKTSAATKYSTYKRDVKLKPGQTVHYLHGRGYYAG